MKQETINRIKIAGEYQKMALRALFPEKMREHLDVIEGELKMMAMEMVVDFMEDCRKKEDSRERSRPSGEPGVKKVDIL